jgi:hypothetical protein
MTFRHIATCIMACSASRVTPPVWDSAYNPLAFYVEPSEASNLGNLLEKHKIVRYVSIARSSDPNRNLHSCSRHRAM